MTTVRQLLDAKGHEVRTIHPDASVFEAIEEMAKRNIGSLVVAKDGKTVGIFTERHYARKVFLAGKSSPETPIGEVMTSHAICVRLEQTIEECMAVMTENRVRHLPVLDRDHLVGIVSIGDLVKSIIADQKFEIEQLTHYIRG
jgi:CBS domain-containing protein